MLKGKRMSESGLVVATIEGVTIVMFRKSSVLDAVAIEGVAEELFELVDKQARRKLTLDFTEVQFLSSQMVGVILSLYKKSKDIGGKLVICGLRDELMKVFKIMKLDTLLYFADSQEEAIAMLAATGH